MDEGFFFLRESTPFWFLGLENRLLAWSLDSWLDFFLNFDANLIFFERCNGKKVFEVEKRGGRGREKQGHIDLKET